MRDQDSADCHVVKERLVNLCHEAGKQGVLVRIACHELESFYFGDLRADEKGLRLANIAKHQKKAKYRIPDSIVNPSDELEKLSGRTNQHIMGSRCIAPHLSLENNTSYSFNVLLSGIQKLITGMKSEALT